MSDFRPDSLSADLYPGSIDDSARDVGIDLFEVWDRVQETDLGERQLTLQDAYYLAVKFLVARTYLEAQYVQLVEQGVAPATPASGFHRVYSKSSDSRLYRKNDLGVESLLDIDRAVDMPIVDSGNFYTTDNVEAALQQLGPPRRLNVTTQTTAYTTTAANDVIILNSTISRTITLVAAATAGAGKVQIFKNINTGTMILDGNASETIDGRLTQTLQQWDGVQVVTNGSNWFLI